MRKCSNCKVDNPDEAKFCRKCGKSLGKAPSPLVKKLKDKRVIFAGTALAIAISGGVGFALYENTPERRYQKNLAMGEKYLNEYDFEKAEEYLNVAKSIDPKKEEAYQDLVKVYKAQNETAKADTVISQAQHNLPSSQQSAFLDKLESLAQEASQIVEASLVAGGVAKDESTEVTPSTHNIAPSPSNNSSPSTQSSLSPNVSSVAASSNNEVVDVGEKPSVDPKDLSQVDDIDSEVVITPTSNPNQKPDSVNSEKKPNQKSSTTVISPSPKRETTETGNNPVKPGIDLETQVISLPNTPYTPIAEIGTLDMAPIALNSDCWMIKKGNEFQFLFPDGSTKKLESQDQLVLQVNPTGNSILLSSACLVENSSKTSNQYYPQEEEVSSCLPNGSENTSYSLEGNYQNSTVPVLVRSSNQNGYWVYNPATQALYGPFKDSEDTSFYSKISRLSDITLLGHNGQIGGPYWIPAHATVQKSTKNEKIPAISSTIKDSEWISKESQSVEDSKTSSEASNAKETNTEELQIWSKDGISYKTGYTNPKIIDWYSVGAFQDDQFHLLNENLEIVYAGPFEQGGSVINSAAPVQINGNWKLVQFKNIPSSGPTTNYSFPNTAQEKTESDTSSESTKQSSEEEQNSSATTTTSSSSTIKKDDTKISSSETTQSDKNSSTKDTEKSEDSSSQSTTQKIDNYFLKDDEESSADKASIDITKETGKTKSEDSTSSSPKSSSQKNPNYFLKDEDSEVTSTGKTNSNTTKEKDKTKSENSSINSSDKAVTSDKGKTNYFEKDKESNSTKENKLKNVTTNDKDKKSVTTSDKSSAKESTSDTKKSSTTTPNSKASNSKTKDKEEDLTGSGRSGKEDTSVDKESDNSDVTNEPIYYSFPEFAGTYTVTGTDWSNSFKLYKDGSFEGEYTEIAEADNPELYPNGVIRICSYSGTFSLKNDRLKITSLSLEKAPGEVEEEGILYEYVGLSDSIMSKGDMFTLYGPGTPYSEFSMKALGWIPTPTTSATVDFIMVQDGTSEFAYV